MPEEVRETRACTRCGVTDQHGHHVQYVVFAHPVTGEGLELLVSKHIQCCAEDGCEICAVTLTQMASPGIGDAFDQALQSPSDDHLRILFEKVAVESPDYNIPSTQEA